MPLARLALLCALTSACSSALLGTPRIEDNDAPRDYLAQARAPEKKCERTIEMLEPRLVRRPYREVSSLSASCYPGARNVCLRRLERAACDHEADAVILSEPTAEGSPPGASTRSTVSISGKAAVWTD